MARNTKPHTTIGSVGAAWSTIQEIKTQSGAYHSGVVMTWQGIVKVYSDPQYTRLDFVQRGQWCERTFQQGYKPRYLATLAQRFAAEMAGRSTP